MAHFQPLIVTCDGKSVSRINWQTLADAVVMEWTFKYIMNGISVKDVTLKADGKHLGSIRQFIPNSAS